MSAALPPLMQDAGVPFDLFIQALTEQLDKAQASMAIKARVGKLPLTFAVKDVSLDLRAFVQMIDDDVYRAPGRPRRDRGQHDQARADHDHQADGRGERGRLQGRGSEVLSCRRRSATQISDDEQRRLERIGVRTVTSSTTCRRRAGADVIARLARMPVNRLQQALMRAAAPRVTRVERPADDGNGRRSTRVHLSAARCCAAAGCRSCAPPGRACRWSKLDDGQIVLAPLASQLGCEAEVDFGDGQVARVHYRWQHGRGASVGRRTRVRA